MLVAAGVILLLILFTALYVAAEFAAVGARRSRLRRLAEDGQALAARILPIVEDPAALDRYIAASQVGITLSSLVLGAYAQAVLAPRAMPLLVRAGLEPATAQQSAAGAVLIALTVLAVILGELVPKAVALQYPTQTALFTVLPMIWSLKAYAWIIRVLNGSGMLILRALGMPAAGHRHVHSPEEIALLIAESRDGGLLEPEEQVRLHRALRLGLRTSRQLMVPRTRLATIALDTPFDDVLRIVAASPYSRLPVCRDSLDDIVGILHTKDVVLHFVAAGSQGTVAALLRPTVRVPDAMSADRLLGFLRERRQHQALVVDAGGTVIGLITLEDVLSELLGHVADEFKTARLLPLRLSDGRVRMPGELALDQACLWLHDAWPPGSESVASFVARHAAHVPEPGARLTVAGLPVEIESMDGDIPTVVIVTPPPPEAAA